MGARKQIGLPEQLVFYENGVRSDNRFKFLSFTGNIFAKFDPASASTIIFRGELNFAKGQVQGFQPISPKNLAPKLCK